MESIKLKDGKVFEIIPMGITTSGKTRTYSFVSELDYGEIEAAFNTENISSIQYLSDHGELLKTYSDCTILKSLSKEFGRQIEDALVADVYSVVLIID